MLYVAIFVLGILGLVSFALIAFGIYEFYVEHKQDMAGRNLHLKHLDQINSK